MKNTNYRFSKIKRKLRDLEKRRVKSVIWTLTEDTKEFVEKLYPTVPVYYSINTRTFFHLSEVKETILKDLHYARKRGKRRMVRKLNEEQRKILDNKGINYCPIKYEIILRR